MTVATVAVLDQFHPAIERMILDSLPPGWQARIARDRTAPEQNSVLGAADIAFVMAAPVPAELIRAAPRLRFIQKLGAGIDRLDLDACKARGIAVAKLAAGNAVPVAEHTVLMMLACYRQLPRADRRTREGQWDKEAVRGINRQIRGKQVGLVGFGAIGREVARVLAGFRPQIVYYDPVRAAPEVEAELKAAYLDLEELIATSDIVSLHMPLVAETRGMIDAGRIRRMKRGAVLINCARGGLVDEEALAAALADGHLMAAGIDTFAEEPPRVSPLLTLENTVITPHFAGATLDNFAGVIGRAIANAESYLTRGYLPPGDAVFVPEKKERRG